MRPQFHPKPIRVAVVYEMAFSVVNPVFIHHPRPGIVGPALPEVSVISLIHAVFLPAVKLPYQGNPLRPRRKDAEYRSVIFIVRSQILVCVKYFSCVKSVKIHILLSFHKIDNGCFSCYNKFHLQYFYRRRQTNSTVNPLYSTDKQLLGWIVGYLVWLCRIGPDMG